MINGSYNFYQDGDLVASQKNVVTWNGHRTILRYLAGLIEGFGGTIGVGISSTAATATDTNLGYEIGRAPVNMRSVKSYGTETLANGVPFLQGAQLVFRGTLPDTFVGKIYEVGMFSDFNAQYAAQRSTNLITAFENNTWYPTAYTGFPAADAGLSVATSSTVSATPIRVGSRGVQFFDSSSALSEAHSFTLRNDLISGNFGNYSQADAFALALAVQTPSTTPLSLRVRFYTDANNYHEGVFTTPTLVANSDNYSIVKVLKSAFTRIGNPDWANVSYSEIVLLSTSIAATGQFMVLLDGISVIPSALLSPDFVTISRSVLASPLSKELGKTLDVEYIMELDI